MEVPPAVVAAGPAVGLAAAGLVVAAAAEIRPIAAPGEGKLRLWEEH